MLLKDTICKLLRILRVFTKNFKSIKDIFLDSCVSTYTFECVSVYPCACLCACLCVCVRLCGLSVCLYLCVYVLVWVSLRMFVCLCLCECTYIQPILPPKLSQSPSVEDSLGRWRDTTCPMIPCGEDFQTWLSPTLSLRLFFRVSYLWRRGGPQIMVGNLMSSTLFWMWNVELEQFAELNRSIHPPLHRWHLFLFCFVWLLVQLATKKVRFFGTPCICQ